jgi:hypothetical protein
MVDEDRPDQALISPNSFAVSSECGVCGRAIHWYGQHS